MSRYRVDNDSFWNSPQYIPSGSIFPKVGRNHLSLGKECNNIFMLQEHQRKRDRAHQHLEYHPKRTHTPEVIMVEQPLKLESTSASRKKERGDHGSRLSKEQLVQFTGLDYKAVPRFGEFCSCCCLPPLPQLACSILPNMYKDFFRAL